MSLPLYRRSWRRALLAVVVLSAAVALPAAEARRRFDLPAGDAAVTLARFAEQADREIVFSSAAVRGVKTNSVTGEFAPREALDLLVARTGLVVAQDRGTGALAVRLEARRPALPTGPPPPPPQPTSLKDFRSAGEEVPVQLSRFEVEADADTSYGALNSNSITLFKVELNKLPVSADVYTEAFMRDTGATSVEEMIMEHTAGAGLALSSPSVATTEPLDRNAESSVSLRGLYTPNYQRDGLIPLNTYSTSSSTGTGFTSNFDMERVEVIRGPQSLLYGSGGGGGVINHVSKQARFGKPQFGSLRLAVDHQGHKKGELDLGFGSRRVAARFAAIRQTVGGRRVDIGGPLQGEYAQLAVRLFDHTTVRVNGTRTRFLTNLPWTPVLTAPSQANDERNGMNLHYLLATNQMAASATGPSGTGIIGGGHVTWDNVDSYGGWQRREKTLSSMGAITLESNWNSWLATHLSAGYKDYLTRYAFATAGLVAPNVASNPLGRWAVVRSAGALGEDRRGAKTKGVRFAVHADGHFFDRRVRSRSVLGTDFSRVTPFFDYVSYYQKGVLPRVGLPAFYWAVDQGPVSRPLWEPFQEEISVGGTTYALQLNNPPDASRISPSNPLGVTPGGGAFYRLKVLTWGVFGANSSEWIDGRLNSIVGFRLASDNQERLYEGVVPTANDPNTYPRIYKENRNKLGMQAGLSYELRPSLRAYVAVSSSHNPSVAQRNDPVGDSPVSGNALGGEVGLKFQNKGERVSGSVAYFRVSSRNEQVQTSLRTFINPAGLNGDHGAPATWYNVDRVVHGLETAMTAAPTRQWRLRLSGAWTAGQVGTSKSYQQMYNDQFHANSQGQVTYRDGTPVYVNATAFNVNSPVVPASTPGAIPLSIAMMSTPGNLYYANPAAVTGQISTASNAGRVLRVVDSVRGPILTGVTGLPISAMQINPGFRPPGAIIVGEKGDVTVGHPEFSIGGTGVYTFADGWWKGCKVGGTVGYAWNVRGYYYYPEAATPDAPRRLYQRPSRLNTSLILGYERRFGRYAWSSQLNVSNLLNRYRVFILPAAIGGFGRTSNAVFDTQPRAFLWTNSLSF